MKTDELIAHARKLRADLSNELPNGVGNTIDALIAAIPSADGLREAAQKALNYIENTEGELGIALDCGDALRAALEPHQ